MYMVVRRKKHNKNANYEKVNMKKHFLIKYNSNNKETQGKPIIFFYNEFVDFMSQDKETKNMLFVN